MMPATDTEGVSVISIASTPASVRCALVSSATKTLPASVINCISAVTVCASAAWICSACGTLVRWPAVEVTTIPEATPR